MQVWALSRIFPFHAPIRLLSLILVSNFIHQVLSKNAGKFEEVKSV